MRAALLVALVACGTPTGLDQTWPPKRGIAVEAIVSADLDGDAIPELLVLASGGEHEAGIYRIEGATDLDLDMSFSPIRAFTTYVPLPIAHPAAALVGSGAAPSVYAAYTDVHDEVVIQQLSSELVEAPGVPIDGKLVGGNALVWMAPAKFPGNVARLIVSNGSAIQHMLPDGNDNLAIPPPMNAPWPTAELALTYMVGATPELVVATPTQVFQTALTGGAITWPDMPLAHAAWLGQTALDLDGDGRPELVGYDPAMHAVCALDLTTTTPRCLGIPMSSNTDVTIALGGVIGGAFHGLIVAQGGPTSTDMAVLADIALSATALTASTITPSSFHSAHGRLATVKRGPGTADAALVIGADGSAQCVDVVGC